MEAGEKTGLLGCPRNLAFCVFLFFGAVNIFLPRSLWAVDSASVERATREVDKPLVREEYMWSVRKRPVIRDENGKVVSEEESGENETSAVIETPPESPTYR